MTTAIVMKLSMSVVGALVVALGASSTVQATSLVTTNSGEVGIIDPFTAAVTQLVNINPTPNAGVAFANNGSLFGGTYTDLYNINLSSQTSSRIGSFATGSILLAIGGFSTSNLLYGLDGDTGFYTIDTQTGTASLVANIDGFAGNALVFDPFNNRILATSGTESGGDSLFSINPTTGAASQIGNTGFNFVTGLLFDEGTLYGYTDENQQVTINPTTGVATFDKNVTGLTGAIVGASSDLKTAASVPESVSILGLLTFGAIGTCSVLKRQWQQKATVRIVN